MRKDNLDGCSAIVLVNFAENYSFVEQDEVQGFHWNNLQATLNPIVNILQVWIIIRRYFGYVINSSNVGTYMKCEENSTLSKERM